MTRSSHDTKRVDTKGDDIIINDTMRVVSKNNKHLQYSHSFIYDHIEDKHNRGMLPFVSLTNTLGIRFT